jgi:hypothetical protein
VVSIVAFEPAGDQPEEGTGVNSEAWLIWDFERSAETGIKRCETGLIRTTHCVDELRV